MDIQELIDQPRESLAVELKGWINPNDPRDQAKIVKAALALRNYGGGYLLIGFHNDTGEPDFDNAPANVRTLFHVDKIQGLVTKHASHAFEITLHFPQRNGVEFPVIEIESGVKTPVATKSPLKAGKLKENTIYIRSLNANNTPSSTAATWKDWERIVEICFDNREADIGRFLRRHLSGLSPEVLQTFLAGIGGTASSAETVQDRIQRVFEEGELRYNTVVKERGVEFPEHGAWEVACVIEGEVPEHSANRIFRDLLLANNPSYTGWPVWVDSRSFIDKNSRPYVVDGAWEALIIELESDWSNHVDFWRLTPSGEFFLYRALPDDIAGGRSVPEPLTTLDFSLIILRTAEAIAVGIHFAKALGCDAEQTQLQFGFKWTKLRRRQLSSWANPARHLSGQRQAYQDEVLTNITVPLNTPLSALGQFVDQATAPLFEVFNGFQLSKQVIEDLTTRLVERKPLR